jgi:hypothetical protein
METNESSENFSPFPYFTKSTAGKEEANAYLVYSSASECKRVKAQSAAEAMRISGIRKPLKIIRFDPMNQVLLPQSNFE